MNPFWLGATLGFGIGLNVAGAVYWVLYKRVRRIIKADLADVRANHARIERELLIARHLMQHGGEGLPPELRQ
jgi:hypothetical protein